jgi:hypothetical protein
MKTATLNLIAPVVHLNGTGRQGLASQYEEVGAALDEAVRTLVTNGPHGRDYYPLGDGAYSEAREQHFSRVVRVQSVVDEIHALYQSLYEAGR